MPKSYFVRNRFRNIKVHSCFTYQKGTLAAEGALGVAEPCCNYQFRLNSDLSHSGMSVPRCTCTSGPFDRTGPSRRRNTVYCSSAAKTPFRVDRSSWHRKTVDLDTNNPSFEMFLCEERNFIIYILSIYIINIF